MKVLSSDEKNEILSLLNKAYASRINNLALSIQLGEKALELSRNTGDKELIAKSLSELSLFYMINGAYSISANMAEESIAYYKDLKDEKGIADAQYALASIYYKTDNLHRGLVYLIDCLSIYKKYNDYHNQARTQKSLGTIYEFLGDIKNAMRVYENSIEAAIQAGDKGLESNVYNPLSGIYLKEGKTDEARKMIAKAITMKKQADDIRGLAFSLYGRAKVYMATGMYTEAREDLEKALEIHLDAGEKLGTGMAYRKLGQLYAATGDREQAKKMFGKALEIAVRYKIAMVLFKSNYHLYELYKEEGDNITALKYLELYLEHKEAVINTQTMQVIESYELMTRMERLEKEAQVQKEKAEIIEKKNLAEQSARVRQEFLSTMSHEVRTPLNAIITISSLLKTGTDAEEQQLIDSLKYAANGLLLIVNDILDFTKLESGKADLQLQPANVKALLQSVQSTYKNQASEKGLELRLQIDEEVAEQYELDDTKLSQILGNLVSNAIKYTEKGWIGIILEKTGSEENTDKIRFTINDTGIGIGQQHFETIFESFSQPYSVTTRKQGGSGLGLAIVKKLVELYGSTIHVESAIGKGSVFSFELELKRCAPAAKKPVPNLKSLDGKVALLAEDNMINAMVALKLLSKWGISVEHAKNGMEAIDISRQKKFDFILMDIHMPEVNGFDATRLIRTGGNPNIHTPIFAFTADITAEQQLEYLSYFNGFLRKPIDIGKLYDTLLAQQA